MNLSDDFDWYLTREERLSEPLAATRLRCKLIGVIVYALRTQYKMIFDADGRDLELIFNTYEHFRKEALMYVILTSSYHLHLNIGIADDDDQYYSDYID